jgi:hypothetical protein
LNAYVFSSPTSRRSHRQASLSSVDCRDLGYRRLRYVRYADDVLLGFAGPKTEAEAIKQQSVPNLDHWAAVADVFGPEGLEPLRQVQRPRPFPCQAASAQLAQGIVYQPLRCTHQARDRRLRRRGSEHGDELPHCHHIPVHHA